ncbi:MAG: hypothetical protein JO314_10590, partial [Acidobacteria bacterium]|nr:hypothetical protein [Acidobacteriota bacterium]
MKFWTSHTVAIAAFFVLGVCCVTAQAQGFSAGQRIEYRDGSKWYPGTIVRVMPEYKQVLVRWDPRDDYPSYTHNGVSTYEQGYSYSDVRVIQRQTPPPPQPGGGGQNNGGGGFGLGSIFGGHNKKDPARMGGANGGGGDVTTTGTGPMSRAEMLGYMKTHGYSGGRPKKDPKVCEALIAEIKQRGVQERLDVTKDDLSPIAENGCYNAENTDVVKASQTNLGAPIAADWLFGTWKTYVL